MRALSLSQIEGAFEYATFTDTGSDADVHSGDGASSSSMAPSHGFRHILFTSTMVIPLCTATTANEAGSPWPTAIRDVLALRKRSSKPDLRTQARSYKFRFTLNHGPAGEELPPAFHTAIDRGDGETKMGRERAAAEYRVTAFWSYAQRRGAVAVPAAGRVETSG